MPKLNKKKVTLGQLKELSPEEQEKFIAPIIEANQKQFAEIAKVAAKSTEAIKNIASFKLPITNIIEAIKLPDIDNIIRATETPKISYIPPVRAGKPVWQLEREAYLTELHIELLEAQLAIAKGAQTPQYDISTGIIRFMGKEIEIPLNTNLEMIARTVLKNVENMKRKWSWDEIVEENREDINIFDKRKIYIAARSINDKVAQATAIKDFLVCKPTSTVQLNPDFLPK